VWDRDGPLSSAEWEQVHMHPYQSERILARSARLAPIARLAGMHHEKHDGSGYHRGSRSNEIPMPARVVAIASAWVAMQQARPHRPGLDPDRAAQELRREADEGRADPQVVDAVLESAGQKAHGRRPKPAGLSEREVEVLRLLATGCSNSDIAARLTISRRTAEHHVQHIYTKIGVSTRPGATLFAVEHDLVEPLGERV
jgi:HD-GYP domain-containing protein (c-di-GMP phosphodiesterase class II)